MKVPHCFTRLASWGWRPPPSLARRPRRARISSRSNCAGAAPVFRHYERLSEAADENGLSRILVGFHFRKAVDEGIGHGRKIGDLAVDRFMRQRG